MVSQIANVVEQVWVEKGVGDTYLIKYKKLHPNEKNKNRPLLLATLYDEFHAREMRVHFRRLYGLDPNACSSADYLNQQTMKEFWGQRKAFNMNMKSKAKMVRAHQELAEQITLALEAPKKQKYIRVDPADLAAKALEGLSKNQR